MAQRNLNVREVKETYPEEPSIKMKVGIQAQVFMSPEPLLLLTMPYLTLDFISMVGRTTAPQRCPHPSPWNLCICYLKVTDVMRVTNKLTVTRIIQVGAM